MSDNDDDSDQVGGRQEYVLSPQGGGGGSDYGTTPEFGLRGFADPRFRDLEKIGLNADWLQLADEIGIDHFLTVWKFISDGRDVYSRLSVPDYGTYRRFQRNCYIRSLSSTGIDVREIKKIVADVLDERLSVRTIYRVLK